MPKVPPESATVGDVGFLLDRSGELDGYTSNVFTFRQDPDATPLLKGASGDHGAPRSRSGQPPRGRGPGSTAT